MFTTTYKTASEVNNAMARVYAYMSMATVISMLVSYLVGTSPELVQFFHTGIMHWVIIFLPVVAVLFMVPFINTEPPRVVAALALMGFAALMGLSMSVIFAVYTMASIFTAFMGAAVLFGTLSLYGYFTKRDLSGIGDFLIVGLIALIIASIINIFIGSSTMHMVISGIGILIFLGFTAYDTQQIREMVAESDSVSVEILGALNLYLDFINLFMDLLQFVGVSNDD